LALEEAAGTIFLSGASQIGLGDALGDATGDALKLALSADKYMYIYICKQTWHQNEMKQCKATEIKHMAVLYKK
jgi:4-hydroxy-3-methylbut-2-en-1-yl diphosphate synthase IspG/GcpE